MLIKDLGFREINQHFFLLQDKKDIKIVAKKIHKKIENPILLFGFIDHEEGLSLRVLGPISYDKKELSIDTTFLEEEAIIRYDFFEEFNVEKVTEKIANKIEGVNKIYAWVHKYDVTEAIEKCREDISLDAYRDLRLIDDVEFLLITKEGTQNDVWGRIEGKSKEGLIECKILDKPKKIFNLKEGDRIYIKYIEHPKYKGLALVKKV